MSASITLAGEGQIALKKSQHKPLIIRRFVFANVPGLDAQTSVDRAAGKPAPAQIVHVYDIPKENAGFVNPNQVVYSAQLSSDIGDWDFNWVGLEDDDGVLFAVSYVPLQQKRKNIPPQQIGNNLTRNFLVAFDGAQALTSINIDASTWQHDFTVRLAGIDERQRLTLRNIYGTSTFINGAFTFEPVGDAYQIRPGLAFIEGIRIQMDDPLILTGLTPPVRISLDVCFERQMNDRVATFKVVYGHQSDYTDEAGNRHYWVALADFYGPGNILDMRSNQPITGPLIEHLAARIGDYPHLRARATTKHDVDLGNVPNAISDDPATNSSAIIASTAALNNLQQQVNNSLTGMVAAFDMPHAPPGWLKRNGANVSRTAYARLFAVIGTRYGAGDGHSTFNIGDSRGLFIRGVDEGRGVDANRALGSVQGGQNAWHTHGAVSGEAGHHDRGAVSGEAGHHGHGGHIDAGGWHSHAAWASEAGAGNTVKVLMGGRGNIYGGIGAGSVMGSTAGGEIWRDFGHAADAHNHAVTVGGEGNHSHGLNIYGEGTHAHPIAVYGAGTHAHPITVYGDGGNETRPINEALLVCIKY